MTVLELIEMLRSAGERAAEHCSNRLHVDVQIAFPGILIVFVLHKVSERNERPEVQDMCTGEVSWEGLPDCDPDMLRKFVDEIVSAVTDDRKPRKSRPRTRNAKGTVIQLSDWIKEVKQSPPWS